RSSDLFQFALSPSPSSAPMRKTGGSFGGSAARAGRFSGNRPDASPEARTDAAARRVIAWVMVRFLSFFFRPFVRIRAVQRRGVGGGGRSLGVLAASGRGQASRAAAGAS